MDALPLHTSIEKEDLSSSTAKSSKEAPKQCPECGKILGATYYNLHLSSVHNIGKSGHACGDCGKHFQDRRRGIDHLTRKHNYVFEENHVFCDHCGKLFSSKQKLNHHKKTELESSKGSQGGSAYHCTTCDKSFVLKTTLLQHIRRKDQGNRPVCSNCDKQFSTKYALERHLKSHPSIKTCQKCSKLEEIDIQIMNLQREKYELVNHIC